jgi:hypothetical protein
MKGRIWRKRKEDEKHGKYTKHGLDSVRVSWIEWMGGDGWGCDCPSKLFANEGEYSTTVAHRYDRREREVTRWAGGRKEVSTPSALKLLHMRGILKN